MSDNLVIKLEMPGKDGKKVPIELALPAVRNLISELLRIAASVEQPDLRTDFAIDPNPVQATAFAISHIEDDMHSARVSIAAGAIDVQFSVPLGPLFEALKALQTQTEPDSTSSPRLN